MLSWLRAAVCTARSAENEFRLTNVLKIPVKEITPKLPSNHTKHAEQSCSKDLNKRECDIHPNTTCYKRHEEQFFSSQFTAATGLAWCSGINSLAIKVRVCLFLPWNPGKEDHIRVARQLKWQKKGLESQEIVDNFCRPNVFVHMWNTSVKNVQNFMLMQKPAGKQLCEAELAGFLSHTKVRCLTGKETDSVRYSQWFRTTHSSNTMLSLSQYLVSALCYKLIRFCLVAGLVYITITLERTRL